ncbi:MAG: T9SS type A sorting domain-containing protein, partial [Flavobacteriaceae bacterium]|nr:T9SS type A sorting domain-containing protein [Flavobacteriaceae bacterium]
TDFRTEMENLSGIDLQEFFEDWIYNEGYPIFDLTWSRNASNQVEMILSQDQSHSSVSFFEAEVPIRLLGENGEVSNLILEHTENNQMFERTVGFQVIEVLLDPDFDLISASNEVTLSTPGNFTTILKIFPNPFQSTLNISKPDGMTINEISILNLSGQRLKTFQYKPSIDLKNLSNGIYFIQLQTNKGVFTKTLLKD